MFKVKDIKCLGKEKPSSVILIILFSADLLMELEERGLDDCVLRGGHPATSIPSQLADMS